MLLLESSSNRLQHPRRTSSSAAATPQRTPITLSILGSIAATAYPSVYLRIACTFSTPPIDRWKAEDKKTYEKDRLEESPFLLRGAFCDVITIRSNDKFSERRHIRGCYEDLPPINILRFMKTASPSRSEMSFVEIFLM